jgi:hypothetical protein
VENTATVRLHVVLSDCHRYFPAARLLAAFLQHHAASMSRCSEQPWAANRARNLLLGISTSWWKSLGKFRPAAHQGVCVAGQVHFGGRSGRDTPCFGRKVSISWSKIFPKFPKTSSKYSEFRPVDEVASPGCEAASRLTGSTGAGTNHRCLWHT